MLLLLHSHAEAFQGNIRGQTESDTHPPPTPPMTTVCFLLDLSNYTGGRFSFHICRPADFIFSGRGTTYGCVRIGFSQMGFSGFVSGAPARSLEEPR